VPDQDDVAQIVAFDLVDDVLDVGLLPGRHALLVGEASHTYMAARTRVPAHPRGGGGRWQGKDGGMYTDALTVTRRALHGVAELLLAGPQYRLSGTIRLRAFPGGFATVEEPSLRVDGDHLVTAHRRLSLGGVTVRELAAAAGVTAGAPENLYSDGSGVGLDDQLQVEEAAARMIAKGFGDGAEALRTLAPEVIPVLWPEHFDIGMTLDEVNYGVSTGDSQLPEPYAYVGPWQPRTGPFWNVSFGAARPLTELTDAAAIHTFFAEAHELAQRD
jgi:hypothetical protein